MDSDDWGVGREGFCGSRAPLGAVSGDVPLLVTMEAESTLDLLLFFFISERYLSPSSSNVHSIGIAVVKRVFPLELGCASSSFISFDPLF